MPGNTAARPETTHTATIYGALILSQLAIAVSVVALESAGSVLPFSWVASIRLISAVPALLIVSVLFEPGSTLPPWDLRCILQMVGISFCGYTINALLFSRALSLTSSMNAAALQPAIIVFTCVISVLLGIEPRRGLGAVLKLVGLGAAIAGAVLMSRVDVFLLTGSFSEATIVVANVLFIIQTLAWSIYLTFQRYPLQKFPSPIAFTAWCAMMGAVPIFVVASFSIGEVERTHTSVWALARVAFAGLLGTGVAFSIISWVVQRASPVLPAVSNSLLPPFTALFRFLFFDSVPSLRDVGGTAIIVSGLAIVTYAQRLEAATAAPAAEGPSVTRGDPLYTGLTADKTITGEADDEKMSLLTPGRQETPSAEDEVDEEMGPGAYEMQPMPAPAPISVAS